MLVLLQIPAKMSGRYHTFIGTTLVYIIGPEMYCAKFWLLLYEVIWHEV